MLEILQKPIRARPSYWAQRLLSQVSRNDWLHRPDIEDLLIALDARLAIHGAIDVDRWVKLFGLQWTSVSTRPKARSTGVIGLDALSASEVAELLILLERCGFTTDPKPLVDLLLPRIKTKPLLTGTELTVYWYERTRHKNMPLSFALAGSLRGARPMRRIKLATGHKVDVWRKSASILSGLVITPPKYRHRKDPIETTCPECSHAYLKGDPESSALHRKEHKERMAYLDPQPHPKLLEAHRTDPGAHWVSTDSPAWKHREMYVRARAFKREMRYDFIQWGSPTGDNDPKVHGVLFTNDEGAIIGACAFRWREGDGQLPCWGLQWIWICPRHRRQRHLERYWPELRARFGAFAIEAPVSDAMRAFAIKHGDAALLE